MTLSMSPVLSRRTLFGRSCMLGLATLPWPAFAEAAQPKGPLHFNAYRNGSYLGFHHIDFSTVDQRLVVDIEIAFDVKLAFVPLYRYRHKNREIWEGDKLVSLDSETDDNGEDHKVKVVRANDRLLVDGTEGELDLAGGTHSTSYWNEAVIEQGQWIDTQSGRLVSSTVTKQPPEAVLVKGQSVSATRYDLAGDITCSLWYADGQWVKLLFIGEGDSEVVYAMEAEQQNG